LRKSKYSGKAPDSQYLQNTRLPDGVLLPVVKSFDDESLAAIVRITGEEFAPAALWLSQIGHWKSIPLVTVTAPVVNAAREGLLIRGRVEIELHGPA
jgi:hypothetical protein